MMFIFRRIEMLCQYDDGHFREVGRVGNAILVISSILFCAGTIMMENEGKEVCPSRWKKEIKK